MTATRPRVGFVLERSLGHITHADNLRHLLPPHTEIEAVIMEIPFDVDGWNARMPLFNSNWTIRAGVRAAWSIAKAHHEKPFDALFVHTQVPAVGSLRWIRKIPSIVSLDATPLQYDELGADYAHETSGARVERMKWRANRAALRASRHIVTWSEWAKRGVTDGYDIDAAKVTVVPPGVTPSLWANPDRDRPFDGTVRILFVGGDLERKGGALLLRAFARLRDELDIEPGAPALELHVVTRAEVPPAAGVTVHRGLGPNSPDLIALYHRSDVFCLPTRGDCLPMVLSEAGAAGLPLVSTAVAAIPEIVRDGETGLIIAVDDEDALLRALRSLVDSPVLRRHLGDAAQDLVSRRYDADKNVSTLVDMLVAMSRPGN